MNKQTETLSKAVALPLTTRKPETSCGYVYVLDSKMIEFATCYGNGKPKADIIVQAVNQFEALCAVAEAARQAVSEDECYCVSPEEGGGYGTCAHCMLVSALAALDAVRKGMQ